MTAATNGAALRRAMAEALAREAAARRAADLKTLRAHRASAGLAARHRAERDEFAASMPANPARRRAAAALLAARHRDEWHAAHAADLPPDALLARVTATVARVLPLAQEADRADITATVVRRLLATHGTRKAADPSDWRTGRTEACVTSADASEARIRGHAIGLWDRARRRADRAVSLDAAADAEDAAADTGERSAWALAAGWDRDPVNDPAAMDAGAHSAERLAERLGLSDRAADALAVSLSGYGTAREYADAAGIAYGTLRNRLSAGRQELAARFPDPAALLAAMADTHPSMMRRAAVAAIGAADDAACRTVAAPAPIRGEVSPASAVFHGTLAGTFRAVPPTVTVTVADAVAGPWRTRDAARSAAAAADQRAADRAAAAAVKDARAELAATVERVAVRTARGWGMPTP